MALVNLSDSISKTIGKGLFLIYSLVIWLISFCSTLVGRSFNRSILYVKSVFTLLELIIVCAILAILLTLLLPALSKARELTKMTVCQSNERQLSLVIFNFANDYNDWLPPQGGFLPSGTFKLEWYNLLNGYGYFNGGLKHIWYCPIKDPQEQYLRVNYGISGGGGAASWANYVSPTSGLSYPVYKFTRPLSSIWMLSDAKRYNTAYPGYEGMHTVDQILVRAPYTASGGEPSFRHNETSGAINILFMDGHCATWTRQQIRENKDDINSACRSGPLSVGPGSIWKNTP